MYFFSQYNNVIGRHIFLSKYVTIDPNQFLKIKHLNLSIENKKVLSIQFLYLFMLTKQKPFMIKRYSSKKTKSFFSTSFRTSKATVFSRKNEISKLIHILSKKLIPAQLPSEFPAVRFTENYTKIIIWNSPLFGNISALALNENAYIRDIPIAFNFGIKHCTLTEKIAFCDFFSFIPMVPSTTLFTDLKGEEYSFLI